MIWKREEAFSSKSFLYGQVDDVNNLTWQLEMGVEIVHSIRGLTRYDGLATDHNSQLMCVSTRFTNMHVHGLNVYTEKRLAMSDQPEA